MALSPQNATLCAAKSPIGCEISQALPRSPRPIRRGGSKPKAARSSIGAAATPIFRPQRTSPKWRSPSQPRLHALHSQPWHPGIAERDCREAGEGERRQPRASQGGSGDAGRQAGAVHGGSGAPDPGDEVIIFSPAWVSYAPCAVRVGVCVVYVPMNMQTTAAELQSNLAHATSPRTKLAILNTPNNPTGQVWTAQ